MTHGTECMSGAGRLVPAKRTVPIGLDFLPDAILHGNYVAYILLLYNTRKGLAYQEYPKLVEVKEC